MSAQSTDAENAKALPSVTDRSDPVKKSSNDASLQSVFAEQYEATSYAEAGTLAHVQSRTRKGKPTAV